MQATIVPIPYHKVKQSEINTSAVFFDTGIKCVFSIAPKVAARGVLRVYENSIFYEHPERKIVNIEPPEREENDIKEFSTKSRKRLFDLFNKINYSSYGVPLFLSLTYHLDNPDTRSEIKNTLRSFHKRLARSLPPFHYIWKLEYQLRGTPHYHLILFPLEKNIDFSLAKYEKIIRDHWLALKSCKCVFCSEYAAKIVEVKTLEAALTYIGKEIAKVQERYENHDLGRVWGASTKLKTNPINQIEIIPAQYEKFIDIAIGQIKTKILLNTKLKPQTIKAMENAIVYLQGLKWSTNNSTIYIDNKSIQNLILDFSAENKTTKKVKSLTLKKYNWKG